MRVIDVHTVNYYNFKVYNCGPLTMYEIIKKTLYNMNFVVKSII